MQQIILQIWNTLGLNPQNDVYILIWFFVFFIIFAILWTSKIYEALFWIVLWISIFIVVQILLWYSGNDSYSLTFMSEKIVKFIVGSSVYLIIILSILVPINWWFQGSSTKNPALKIFVTIFLSSLLILLFSAILAWLIEQIYIFKIDNAFSLLKKWPKFTEFLSWSKIYAFLISYIHIIIVFGVFYVIYKLLFADIVSSMLKWFLSSLFKKKDKWAWDWDWEDYWHH
ncbi:MAG: hypothetical protein ACD_49C00067G0014 [uncultured bacterium (gcode 4)]|uniref:Uncharacterized protein n=1 Tax=uncultured bacterium (gcode 4) TaxID=1234023 RepID=K2BB92_9BACT|nr:MAG: hypothetical protein ACD_49C00067G0014 [uncultured bacterium (gcode 4)]